MFTWLKRRASIFSWSEAFIKMSNRCLRCLSILITMQIKICVVDLLVLLSAPLCLLRSSQPRQTSPTSAQAWRFSASCWQCCSPQPSWPTLSHFSGASPHAWPVAIPKCCVLSTPFFLASWASSRPSPVSWQWFISKFSLEAGPAAHRRAPYIRFFSEILLCHVLMKL